VLPKRNPLFPVTPGTVSAKPAGCRRLRKVGMTPERRSSPVSAFSSSTKEVAALKAVLDLGFTSTDAHSAPAPRAFPDGHGIVGSFS